MERALARHPHARAVLGAALGPPARPSHAYLFHGPAGAGKGAAARAFAAELLAEGAADPGSARARVLSGAHPDLTWVAPSGAHEMVVADVEVPVIAAAARTPFEAERRVFVIERADTLNEPAANRLLKTLEEPAHYVTLVLLTSRPTEVLPTIVSRCQRVRFEPLVPGELAELLRGRGVDAAAAEACAHLSLGDGERALELALGEGPGLRAAAERFARAALACQAAARPWEELLAHARDAGAKAASDMRAADGQDLDLMAAPDRRRRERELDEQAKRMERRATRASLDGALALAGLWFRDLAALAWDAEGAVLHRDRREALAQDAGRDPQRLREAVELVEETRRRLALNVSEDLACEALAYRLEAVVGGAITATSGAPARS